MPVKQKSWCFFIFLLDDIRIEFFTIFIPKTILLCFAQLASGWSLSHHRGPEKQCRNYHNFFCELHCYEVVMKLCCCYEILVPNLLVRWLFYFAYFVQVSQFICLIWFNYSLLNYPNTTHYIICSLFI